MAATAVTPEIISKIIDAEKKITHSTGDVIAGGPTAMAQKHSGEAISSKVLHDVTEGEKIITHQARPVAGGPTAVVQSVLAKSRDNVEHTEDHHTGVIDPTTISKIAEAEKKITHSGADLVAGGPTAMAQKHSGEGIGRALHDITEGEKKITQEGRPIAGGPTAVAMSEMAKARQETAEKQTAV